MSVNSVSRRSRCGRAGPWAARFAVSAMAVLVTTSVTASSAGATVLLNAPTPRVQVHHKITVGVWYRTFDGGPRVYRFEVIDPDGRVIFTRHGKAPETWKLWHVRLDEIGVTKTVYRVKDADGDWVRRALRTRVVRG